MKKTLLDGMATQTVNTVEEPVEAEELDEDGNPVEESGKANTVAEDDPNDYIIESATPLGITSKQNAKGDMIATLSWLCKNKNTDLFTISTNYLLENMTEVSTIKRIQFHDENTFLNQHIANTMIIAELPSYLSDFQFSTDEDILDNATKFYIDAVKITKEGNAEKVTFTVPIEMFASMAYIDDYITDNIVNNHDLVSAIAGACPDPNSTTSISNMAHIKDIISMAPVEKTKSNNIVVEFGFVTNAQDYVLLCPFNIGSKLPRSKFKGATTKRLEENYFTDGDQYLSVFLCEAHIKNSDKDYLIIKAKNKNNDIKLFFMDNSIKEQLTTRVRDY